MIYVLYSLAIVVPVLLLVFISKKIARRRKNPLTPFRRFTVKTKHARRYVIGKDLAVQTIPWEEPNRADTPPLHIGGSGERFSTLTGVWWLDDQRLVVNHRSGLRLALFDLSQDNPKIGAAEIGHLTDNIAALRLFENEWEIAVAGCWASAYSLFIMHDKPGDASSVTFTLKETCAHKSKDFSHGVSYDSEDRLCLAFHTGENPRIEIGKAVYKLPAPWGARDLCFDPLTNCHYAVAVSTNPRRSSYKDVMTTIWALQKDAAEWYILCGLENVHSDTCDVYRGRVWIPDQAGDRALGVNIQTGAVEIILTGESFDFPHGLSVSKGGKLAIVNYGSSAMNIIDIGNI
tara:strand:+ start:71301 stop:72338 length:1038 start_codon:yes stop_codon:yes gene_type:complete